MTEDKIKHLEFIQNIITRMNTNSFQIKEWMITIVSALLALYASSQEKMYIFVAIVPTLVFWCLDAYYLQQERKFRGLYDDVVKTLKPQSDQEPLKPQDKPISIPLFSMDLEKYNDGDYCFRNCFWSISLKLLYGLIIIMLLVVFLLLKYGIVK